MGRHTLVRMNSQKGEIMKSLRMLAPILMLLTISGVASAQTVSVTPSSIVVTEPITLSFTAPSGSSASDWIGLYTVGDPNTSYQAVFFTNGATSGSWDIYGPSSPGNYEFRYLVNNSFTSVATSNTLTVAPAVGFSVSITPSSAAPGNTITVTWTAPAGRPTTDWIGIYAAGEPDNHNYDPARWVYTGGATSGTFITTMPSYGPIVARYLLRNKYTHVAESGVVALNYSVSASQTTAAQGAPVTASWTAPVGTSTIDWVGLFKVGDSVGQWVDYVYTGGTPTGSAVFTMPNAPGQYEFRYYFNGGSVLKATSQVITVQ